MGQLTSFARMGHGEWRSAKVWRHDPPSSIIVLRIETEHDEFSLHIDNAGLHKLAEVINEDLAAQNAREQNELEIHAASTDGDYE